MLMTGEGMKNLLIDKRHVLVKYSENPIDKNLLQKKRFNI